MPIRLTQDEVIARCLTATNHAYSYELLVYKNTTTKVIITCAVHGNFLQTPKDHMNGHGCPKCKSDNNSKRCRHTKEIFANKANKKHSAVYDYSEVAYIDTYQKVCIICCQHGRFWQTPNSHLKDNGCPKCGLDTIGELKRLTAFDFLARSKVIQNYKYDYSEVVFINATTKVAIVCPLHGNFLQTPVAHLAGQGCPKCKESKGERTISIFLDKNGIIHKSQYQFSDCIYKRKLYFDFAIMNQNTPMALIEYHGEQHYKPMRFKNGDKKFRLRRKRDKIKQNYCKLNNIPLLIIPYTKFKTIETEVKNFLASLPTVS